MSFVMRMLAALIWGLHDLVVRVASPRGAVAPLLLTALLAGTVLLASSRSCPSRAADEAGLALLPRTAPPPGTSCRSRQGADPAVGMRLG